MMSELRSVIEGLTWTVGGELARVAGLLEGEPERVHLVVTATLFESLNTISDAIYGKREGFFVMVPKVRPVHSLEALLVSPRHYFSCILSFIFVFKGVELIPFVFQVLNPIVFLCSSLGSAPLSIDRLLFLSTSSFLSSVEELQYLSSRVAVRYRLLTVILVSSFHLSVQLALIARSKMLRNMVWLL